MFPHISGYRINERIHQSAESVIYLAIRDSDKQQVAIKTLSNNYPQHQQIARFLHEFNIHKKLNGSQGVAQVYSLENTGHQQALVLEYISGGELSLLLKKESSDLIS